MLRYSLRRLTFLPIILFAGSRFTFLMLRVLPGQDPALVIAGQGATKDQIAQIHAQLGLDHPIFPFTFSTEPPFVEFHRHSQYAGWIGDALRGDFGTTYQSHASIRHEFIRRFPASFEIVFLSLCVSAIAGIVFGILSAMFRNSLLDYGVRMFAVFGASIPEFFLLTLLIIIPSYLWNYAAPVGGYVSPLKEPWTNARLYVPPAIVLGIGGSAGLMRLVRTTMLEILRADYIRTAHAKGLSQRAVIVGHGLRNAATPILTALGTSFVAIFGGSIIAEQIMSLQGVGQWFFASTLLRDLPVIQFLAVYTAAVVIIVNLIVDLSYAVFDRRVRYS